MTISSPGIGSGLDVNSLVSKLMATEQQPLVDLAAKEASYQSQISAYGSFQGTLSTLQTAVTSLSSASLFSAYSTSASTAGYFSSSANSTASAGSYSLEVTKLAQSHKLATNASVDTTTAIGTGVITFQYGTYNSGTNTYSVNGAKPTQTVTIDAAHNTLSGIRDAINAANVGVSASITNDGTGFRLVLTSKDSGVANSLKVSVDNPSLSALTYDPLAAGVKNLTQTMAAQNAAFTLDGMAMSKASNTISDAIQGVTLTLTQATVAPVTLTVARDTATIQSSVNAFVNAYNAAQTSIKSLSAYNATNNTAAVLTGDATLRTIQNQMRSILNSPLTTSGGGLTMLSDIGVSFQKDGTLALNTTKLNAVLADPSKDISTLFASVGKPSDSLVTFGTATSATLAGNYAVNITQAATQGNLTGSVGATPGASSFSVVAASNDTLSMVVDGAAATITLAAGTYTPTALAAQVQSQINGATALSSVGASVSVGYNGTQGNAVGSSAAGLTITTGVNDALSVTVDGTSVSVTLSPGTTYTASTLAAEVQNKINAALAIAAPGKSLVVSTSNSGVMTLTSDSYGAASSVSVTAGNGVANLLGAPVSSAGTGTGTMLIKSTHYGSTTSIAATGNAVATLLGTPVATAGVDVAGTIDGQSATGIGQALTGTVGGPTGLTLTIAGSTLGSRGTVAYAAGYAAQLVSALTSMTDTTTGTIASRITGLQSSITTIGKQRIAVNLHLAADEARYRAEFTALDTLVASMNSTASFLSQQLTSLQNNPIKI